MSFNVQPDETLEDLQINGLFILQKKEAFRFGMDAVLLSNFVSVKKQHKILDLGTGTGILPILLAAKTGAQSFKGLEISSEAVDMAKRSVEGNGLGDKIEIIHGDIKEAVSFFGAGSFDAIVTNPPYTKVGSGIINPADSKAVARHEVCCTLEDVLTAAARLLKPQGRFFMVHRPDRLSDIIEGMRKVKIEPKTLRMVCPREESAPSLILVYGLKNGNPGLNIPSNLVIYNPSGQYTEEAQIQYGIR